MNILDTRNENTIKSSLAQILSVNEILVDGFITETFAKNIWKSAWEIDTSLFTEFFKVDFSNFKIDKVTFHHIASRMKNEPIQSDLKTLPNFLCDNNATTRFLKENGILFVRNKNKIDTYYKGKLIDWNKYSAHTARAINRLWGNKGFEQDICINGYLFSENMDNVYTSLIHIPEILQDVFSILDIRDVGYKYMKLTTGYLFVCCLNIDAIVFDDNSKQDYKTKAQKLISYAINYLTCKMLNKPEYIDNVCIRALDNKTINLNEIIDIIKIDDGDLKRYFR